MGITFQLSLSIFSRVKVRLPFPQVYNLSIFVLSVVHEITGSSPFFGVWGGRTPAPHPKNGYSFNFREVLIMQWR